MRTILAALAIGIAGAASAEDCNQDAAVTTWDTASANGVVHSVQMLDGVPTIFVDRHVWGQLDLQTRLGLIETFDCAVAGPDNVLGQINIVTPQGIMMAEWNGLRKRLNASE